MEILKKIGIVLLALLVLALVAAAFMPKHFEYERSTDINASKEVVFGIVNDLKTQETWGLGKRRPNHPKHLQRGSLWRRPSKQLDF
ncbi:MAG: hypothetical protein IPM82_17005 [Saprospiraceae bacterium]|nr:hypothetical protein [Saprospiraceae bacterium]